MSSFGNTTARKDTRLFRSLDIDVMARLLLAMFDVLTEEQREAVATLYALQPGTVVESEFPLAVGERLK